MNSGLIPRNGLRTFETSSLLCFETWLVQNGIGKGKKKENRVMMLMEKTLYSMGAGLIDSALANPLDMALIRFQAGKVILQLTHKKET